jgi:hypothetical protein
LVEGEGEREAVVEAALGGAGAMEGEAGLEEATEGGGGEITVAVGAGPEVIGLVEFVGTDETGRVEGAGTLQKRGEIVFEVAERSVGGGDLVGFG